MTLDDKMTGYQPIQNHGDPRGPLGPVCPREDTEECRIDLAIAQLNSVVGHRDADGNTWYGIDDFCKESITKLLRNYSSLIAK